MAYPGFNHGASSVPSSKVEISISCRALRNRDSLSKSDPMCVLFTKTIDSDSYHEIGRTEVIKDTLNPDFVEKFVMDYFFEESQKLKFELYDADSESSKLKTHDFLGRLECTLGEIVGSPGNRLDKSLSGDSKQNGTITVRAEELAHCKEVVTIHLGGNKLDKKDVLGKSDPFLVISRANADGSFTVVQKTEVHKNTLNPTWRPFTMRVGSLCQGDHNKPIKFECFDWDSDGDNDLIGIFTTTLEELSKQVNFDLINPKKQAKKGKSYKNSGVINVVSCRIEQEHSFLDYVQGGMEINFTVAIDFTQSNGDPSNPNSLHYIKPYEPNQYASALWAVGEIIQDYDSDKMFPALGFGAKLPNGQASHEFFLNGNPSNPYCQGIQGVMQAYHDTLRSVQLWGPTNFSPCINHVAKFASAYQDGSHYFILLILTDGVITDMPQTKEAIVRASTLPMSIVIIGVGDADFSAMEVLDADKKQLATGRHGAARDIVQFVPYQDFVGGRFGNNTQMTKAYLAKAVLAEIPAQVTGYMKMRGFQPRPPQAQRVPGPAAVAPPAQGAQPPAGGPACYGAPQQPQAPYPGQGGYGAPQGPPQPGQGWAGPPPTGPPPAGGQAPYPNVSSGAPYPQGGGQNQGQSQP